MDYQTLYGKTVQELRALAKQQRVRLPAGIRKTDMIERLLAALPAALEGARRAWKVTHKEQ